MFLIWNDKKVNILVYIIPDMERIIKFKLLQKVEQNGRITFPAEFKRKYGIQKGDYVEVEILKIIRYEEVPA